MLMSLHRFCYFPLSMYPIRVKQALEYYHFVLDVTKFMLSITVCEPRSCDMGQISVIDVSACLVPVFL